MKGGVIMKGKFDNNIKDALIKGTDETTKLKNEVWERINKKIQ